MEASIWRYYKLITEQLFFHGEHVHNTYASAVQSELDRVFETKKKKFEGKNEEIEKRVWRPSILSWPTDGSTPKTLLSPLSSTQASSPSNECPAGPHLAWADWAGEICLKYWDQLML